MTIRFTCPHCHKALKAPDDKAGVKFPCPSCGQPIAVPPAHAVSATPRQVPLGDAGPLLNELLTLLNGWAATQRRRRQGLGCAVCVIVVFSLALLGAPISIAKGETGPGSAVGGLLCSLVAVGGGIFAVVKLRQPLPTPLRIGAIGRALAAGYPEEVRLRGGPSILYDARAVGQLIWAERSKCPSCHRWEAQQLVRRHELDRRLGSHTHFRTDETICTDRDDPRFGKTVQVTHRTVDVPCTETQYLDVLGCKFCPHQWQRGPYWA